MHLKVPIDKLQQHEGHEWVLATYFKNGVVWNYALECEDCEEVIADLDLEVGEEVWNED